MDEKNWLEDWDIEPVLHNSHVMLFYGYDITFCDLLAHHDFAECPFCSEEANSIPTLILGDELIHGGTRRIHFVVCGNCGTRGPWGRTESDALNRWNRVYSRVE
jgi:Lar family restriction alleviation protein